MYIGCTMKQPFSPMIQTYEYQQFSPAESLIPAKQAARETVSVVIPALNEESTIGPIVSCIVDHLIEKAGLVDEIVVIDGNSDDRTAEIAGNAGAKVYNIEDLEPTLDMTGKGYAMWKALTVADGSIVVYVDADIRNFDSRFVFGLLGPMLANPETSFVKACYDRPYVLEDGTMVRGEGGRVTEILVRPLLAAFYPELFDLRQPLAGEYAIRRSLAERIPFLSGYGVELGLLIAINRLRGPGAFAQTKMGTRIHRNRTIQDLGRMSFGILTAAMKQMEFDGLLKFNKQMNTVMPSLTDSSPEPASVGDHVLPPIIDRKG